MKSDESRRAIGKLVSVSAERFVVEMHVKTENFTIVGFDDVHYVARIGAFIALPVSGGSVIAEVIGMRDHEPQIQRNTNNTSKDLDKAASAKFLDLVPVGFLPSELDAPFSFGVSVFPSLYSDALYVLDSEIDRIFDVATACELIDTGHPDGPTRYKALTVGESVVFSNYDVKVRIDDFFGGHSAVLGNTGSGKSCTVATILQSLFCKPDPHPARGATFLVLDVNGEYPQAFTDLPTEIRRVHFKVPGSTNASLPDGDGSDAACPFLLPHWFLSIEEWELLLRASERTQQPVLRTALGLTSLFAEDGEDEELESLRNHILASCIRRILTGDQGSPSKKDRILALLSSFSTADICRQAVEDKVAISYGEMADEEGLNDLLDQCTLDDVTLPSYLSKAFPFEQLLSALELAILYEEAHGNRQIRDYCSQLLTRFCSVRDREDFAFLRDAAGSDASYLQTTEQFVEETLGYALGEQQDIAQVILLDLSDIPDEVVEVVASVVTRLVFERLRRHDPRNSRPVHLILEEAHRYVGDGRAGYTLDASRVFERVAKEGRKYGLFLILASQRPSELSATVLSQCSNFIVHRIQNPDDLHHVRQMTPYVSSNVIARLPSLPKQHALIFGSAVNLPTTFRVRNASPRPKSDDAMISKLWFRSGSSS